MKFGPWFRCLATGWRPLPGWTRLPQINPRYVDRFVDRRQSKTSSDKELKRLNGLLEMELKPGSGQTACSRQSTGCRNAG
ncbi:hypothetical protein NPIL_382231 [Nephila pilipes]|uniref:Uncharacterized protein n=1 Tax=Nephila pilipes TaxID=299642 RepID=A0A8X6NKC2_NEPPI|nr:hypothetical protein NPIL_382231 [Nephila pilipes]